MTRRRVKNALIQYPDVMVSTKVNDRGLCLELTAPRAEEPIIVQLKAADLVRRRCGKLGADLGKVTAMIQERGSAPPQETARHLGKLASFGRMFLYDVLLNPQEDFGRLVQFLQAACPTWHNHGAPTPLIHTIAETDQYFPWELLPLFNPIPTLDAQDQLQLEEVCLAFPGFAAVVERRDPDQEPDTPFLTNWDRLPIRMVYDASYSGAQQEVGFFRGRGDLFRLEGPYPRNVADVKAPTLVQQLCDPALGVDGNPSGFPDQVVHFACHCEGSESDTTTFAYRLGDEHGQPMRIQLDDLQDELMQHWALAAMHSRHARRPKPLVFLNACGTAVMDPASAVSLLKPFRDNRNRGIIATAANVPDRVAAEISRWFYTNLLVKGANVGQALHEAKWRLLQDWGNPLGLLYAIHAFAGMRIAPVPTYPTSQSGGSS
jgi:hypothetical protein